MPPELEALAQRLGPEVVWIDTAEAVARTGLDALDRGRVVAIPGTPNRLMANISNVVPKQFLVPLLASRSTAPAGGRARVALRR